MTFYPTPSQFSSIQRHIDTARRSQQGLPNDKLWPRLQPTNPQVKWWWTLNDMTPEQRVLWLNYYYPEVIQNE
jgi:hypothetical protein